MFEFFSHGGTIMTFTLTIELGNDAMRTGAHVARALTDEWKGGR
jgi:hypothetical protein